ncbi:IDEAL domain-containing protein [Brevibacillus choshinensis]|uniref:IDEAL domain-containing protein n=1 Tax=Brevibacillus choshinensis TaxID=54911 RepID=UPI002E1AC2BB|nr:IDEAL domain-containing protein [Brevibacillus choshinensis]MED4753693.1 IDEAL domain-containing protein [Brevibacillus choshinensis]
MMSREEQSMVGEWVRGKTKKGELIHGFVESIDSTGSTVHVYVVNCDNDMTVGKVIAIPINRVELMNESSVIDEEQLRDLIDLALATRDQEWFRELVARSRSLQKNLQGREKRTAEHRYIRNRLGTSAIWE